MSCIKGVFGDIKAVHQDKKAGADLYPVKDFGREGGSMARAFHSSFPEYEPTPLVKLERLAAQMGIKGMYLKDESFRFGLNAFKVLGGSYAIGKYIAKALDMVMKDEIRDSKTAAALLKYARLREA